ncbi:MAG: hypothetical protein QXX68_01295 [Candidatus Pacearchaeota archaeon]
MAKKRKKQVRTKGKIKLSEYFKDMKEGESVSVVKDSSIPSSFSKRIVGRVGKIIGKRGSFMLVQVKEGKKLKTHLIHPINLRRVK